MSHHEEGAGVVDARRHDPEQSPTPQSAGQPRDQEAELAELRRALLVYGTAGIPAAGAQQS
jgi:hypothetical protein